MESEETIRRAKIAIVALLLAILILFGVRLYVVESLATQGIVLDTLQDQIKTLDTENMQLHAQILEQEAYITIATKAAALGLTERARSLIYLP